MSPSHQTFVSLNSERAAEIRHGDLLLWRRRGLISIAGRGFHSHAATAAVWDGDLFCLEMREFHGGRAVSLASQVEKYPGCIDVFEVNPDNREPHYDRTGAVRYMRRLCGKPYGYWNIFWAALTHLPFVRLFTYVPHSDIEASDLPPHCSEARAASDQFGGGVDPVPHLANRMTEPADLARSKFYRYRFTLEV